MKKTLVFALCLSFSAVALPWKDPAPGHYAPSAHVAETQVKTKRLGDNSPMRVRVYLPPGYDPNGSKKYPVLYVTDGQNVFEPDPKAGHPINEWKLDESLERLIRGKKMVPIIVVAVDTRAMRIDYLPSRETFSEDSKAWQGGHAEALLDFLKDLKVEIDKDLRTEPGDSGIMGSSLGGLFALHAGFKYPDRFRRAAALSPSLWWGKRPKKKGGEELISDAQVGKGPELLWMDMGDHEISDGTPAEQAAEAAENVQLANGLTKWIRQHRPTSRIFHFQEFKADDRDDHNEASWAKRLDDVLPWLYRVGQ